MSQQQSEGRLAPQEALIGDVVERRAAVGETEKGREEQRGMSWPAGLT